MKKIVWDSDKAILLANDDTREFVSFEDCIVAIEEGNILDDIANPSIIYPHQRMYILEIGNYAYVVPYVEDSDYIFLKTVFPSRKHTAIYLRNKTDG